MKKVYVVTVTETWVEQHNEIEWEVDCVFSNKEEAEAYVKTQQTLADFDECPEGMYWKSYGLIEKDLL